MLLCESRRLSGQNLYKTPYSPCVADRRGRG